MGRGSRIGSNRISAARDDGYTGPLEDRHYFRTEGRTGGLNQV